MFENVDSIEWERLTHSHGTAEDVPFHLDALVGPSDGDRAEALEYFWNFLLHQGTRYEASPYVVPFLFEALQVVKVSFQPQLIDLLLALAIGNEGGFLPYGYDLKREEQRAQEEPWAGLFDGGSGEDGRAAYFGVHERAGLFAEFLSPDHHPETRLAAGFAVSHFAQSLSGVFGQVADYIRRESDESQLQGLILCSGMLGRYAGAEPDVGFLTHFLGPDRSQSLRVSAAIALTTALGPRTPESALHTILTALHDAWKLTPARNGWWWNEGDLLGYAALVLPLAGTDRRDEIAYALCEALAKAEACSFAIPQTLLDVLFPGPKPAGGRQASELDVVQRASLNVLLRTKHWRTWMLDSKVLPRGLTGDDYRHALRKFLDEVTDGWGGSDAELFGRGGNVSTWDFKKYWP